MSRSVRIIALGLTISIVTAAVAIHGGAASARDPVTAPPTTVATAVSPPAVDDVIAAFESAGVTITGIDRPVAGSVVTLTDWQAGNLARQASVGAGIDGTTLRTSFPVPDDVVPIDALVAAWLITGESASADAARSIMPVDVATITDPAKVVYPWAAIVLFVHDLTVQPGSEGTEPAGLGGSFPAAGLRAPASSGGVCGALSDFYQAMTTAIVTALEDVPVLGTLAELAIQLFEQVLGTVLKPLLLPIQLAIAALGVAAVVAHIVDPWVFFIDKDPLLVIDYGIAPSPGNAGSFTARIVGGAILEWPAALEECADLANVTLPDLDPNGATVTWTTSFGPHATVTVQETTMGDEEGDFTADLEYVTAVESPETAQGALVSAPISVTATVVRPEDQQLGAIVELIVGNALSALPQPVAELLASLAGSAIGSIATFNDPTGTTSITVRFHTPPPPESTVPETSPPTTAPVQSCIGRVLPGRGQLQGLTLEIRADGTWVLDFTAYPPQETQGVVVVLEGQMTGTWTPSPDGAGFVIVADPDPPFTATGSYEGVTLTLTMEQLAAMLGAMFGVSASSQPGLATCSDGTIVGPNGEVMFG